ncbi:MAG: twin-arginine translocase TatA/TatE family subunit [Anaerolineae bacterium]
MPHLGPTELIIILVIVILIFGGGKLASLGGALGKGVKDFRSAVKDPEKTDGSEPEVPSVKASAGKEAEAAEAEGDKKDA